jgi:hypothetical protein
MFQNEGDIEEHLKGGAEIDFGFMFKDDDDIEGAKFALEIYLFDDVGVAVFLEEGQMAFVKVDDIIRPDILEDSETGKTAQKLGKKIVVIEDNLETVVFGFFNGHKYLHTYLWDCASNCFNGGGNFLRKKWRRAPFPDRGTPFLTTNTTNGHE